MKIQVASLVTFLVMKGKVLPVGGIQKKVRAAFDAGIKEVILPIDNLKEARGLPSHILEAVALIPVDKIESVLQYALIVSP